MIDVKHFLKDHAYQNVPLSFDEAYALGIYLIEGCRGNKLAQIQCMAILSALHTKATYRWKRTERTEKTHGHELPETAAEQIAGICGAVFEYDIAKSEFGFLAPRVAYAMDNCGMGGDLIVTANLSTIAAFVAATAGVPMCKHGSPANADIGRHGSSDFIELCGINRFADKKVTERCLESLSFAYTEALDTRYKLIHLQTHEVAKLPHMNDIIGPITNPLNPKLLSRRVLGINHLIPPRVVADSYLILNKKGITHLEHGLFLRGFVDGFGMVGIDELSVCKGGSQVVELKSGKIDEHRWVAEDFGLTPIAHEFISPPPGMSKGDFSLQILRAKAPKPALQIATANAAILFYLADSSRNLKECYQLAEEILIGGKAHQQMLAVKEQLSS